MMHLRRAGASALLLQAVEFFFLPDVGAESDDLGVVMLPLASEG